MSLQLFERQHVLPVYMCVCAFKQRDHVWRSGFRSAGLLMSDRVTSWCQLIDCQKCLVLFTITTMPDNHLELVPYQKTRVGAKERLVPEQQQTIWREPALAAEEAAAAESDNGVSTGSSCCIPSVLLIQDLGFGTCLGIFWDHFGTTECRPGAPAAYHQCQVCHLLFARSNHCQGNSQHKTQSNS